MKEEFLHYLWKFQKFNTLHFSTQSNESLEVIFPGQHNHDAGPDFLRAQIRINAHLWVGQVEIHTDASHWYAHKHDLDDNYDNVILHVVWNHNAEIYRKDGTLIPTLVLNDLVSANMLKNYEELFRQDKLWIACEKELPSVDQFTVANWMDRLFVERIERFSKEIQMQVEFTNGNWEEVFFRRLAKSFGSKVNGASFLSMAQSLSFTTVRKLSQNSTELEALFMGQLQMLDHDIDEPYFISLQSRYGYQKYKMNLQNEHVVTPKYFRLRPNSFPTIRLSQLAGLYEKNRRLFSVILEAPKLNDLYKIFDISASEYWDTHYKFGTPSKKSRKKLSEKFIDGIIINAIIPVKFCYAKQMGIDHTESLIDLASQISAEKNSIVKKYNSIKQLSNNALGSQALLELKNHYCDQNQCLNCAIGAWYLRAKKE